MSSIFFGLVLLAWAAAYGLVLRPWLRTYRRTAGLMAALQGREAKGLAWLRLRVRGVKTIGLLFVTSVCSGGFDAVRGVLGLTPSDIAPFQDPALWKAFVGDEMAIKATAVATLAATLLLLDGKLRDLRTVPRDEPRGNP